MPNFFILGFTKCATTSIYDALSRHPDVSAPRVKEPHFYFSRIHGSDFTGPADDHTVNQMFVTDIDNYNSQYDYSKKIQVDGSAMSVESLETMRLIAEENPEAKVLIMLRAPLGRSFSAYSHMVRDAREKYSFRDAISKELEGKKEGFLPIWMYIDSSRYSERVRVARELFGDRLMIGRYEDYIGNPFEFMDSVSGFLGIDSIDWKLEHSNKSGVPKFKILQRIIQRDSPLKRLFVRLFPRKQVAELKKYIMELNRGDKPKLKEEDADYLKVLLANEAGKCDELEIRDKNVVKDYYA
ncbi:sulfotransferase family protein [Oceanobacter kriegii]|uniref:sulfotransferase family protein n=1 Tax=Oceanobacter kriegii TaxID=64972 RepID=UPI0004095D21|nr:sulfotransferase [Oceanobacter kriegii]